MSNDEPRTSDEVQTPDPDVPMTTDDARAGASVGPAGAVAEPVATTAAGAEAAERRQLRKERIALLMRSPAFIVGMLILLFWVFSALFPSVLTSWGPNEVVRLADGSTIPRKGPGSDAIFGTDKIGNSVYSRVIYGARPVLIMAPLAALIAAVAGTMLGLAMGYFQGWVDEVLSRIVEAFLSIPVILLAIMALVIFGQSAVVVVFVVSLLFTPVVARTVRSAVLGEARLDYVTSARLRGEGGSFIMFREIFPNITSVVVVEFTVRVGYAIFTIATLAFLGFNYGDATSADWGKDVSNNYELISGSAQWWPAIFPALAIASLVIAINLVADSLDRVLKS